MTFHSEITHALLPHTSKVVRDSTTIMNSSNFTFPQIPYYLLLPYHHHHRPPHPRSSFPPPSLHHPPLSWPRHPSSFLPSRTRSKLSISARKRRPLPCRL